jgi:hypothetical protein
MNLQKHLIPGKRNRISDLRKALSEISRIELDAELVRMALDSEIFLYSHDDPQETTDEDRVNAVLFAGQNCYIVYINPDYIPPKKVGRGGKRAGAGAKHKFNGLPTKPVRVPIKFEKQIIEYAQQLANSSNPILVVN